MSSIRRPLLLIAAALFTMLASGFTQPSIELIFQGRLTDARGEKISGETFELSVKLISSDPGKTELWSRNETSISDENGWINFSIPDISSYIDGGNETKNPIVIRMEFLPNNKTTWLQQGEDFMVTYTLTPTMKDDVLYLKMSRMEGSELTVHLEDHLYAFKDEYPFAYLTGGFLLTDTPPLNKNSIDDLKAWVFPVSIDNESTTRGVKGSFPKGGYRKR